MGLADRLRELADEAEAMEARLMPEGMAWPMVDGEPVVIGERLVGYGSGDDGYEVVGVRPTCGWVLVKSCDHIHRDEGPVILEWDASKCRRPAPKVLDADGVPLSEGETVYEVEGTGHAYKVVGIRVGDGDPLTPTVVTCDEGDGTSEHFLPSQLTHRAPVLAADGEPLEVGQTVWRDDGEMLEVLYLRPDGLVDCCGEIERPERLTHERPKIDSWERLEEDARELDISRDWLGNVRQDRGHDTLSIRVERMSGEMWLRCGEHEVEGTVGEIEAAMTLMERLSDLGVEVGDEAIAVPLPKSESEVDE